MRTSAEQALARAQAPKPLLLVLGQWLCVLGGGVMLLLLALAPFDLGSYSISGEVVSGPEFVRRGGLLFGAAGVYQLVLAFGLWRERAWVRPLMVAYWVGFGALVLAVEPTPGGGPEDVVSGMSGVLLCAGIAAWYLYRKRNVAAYFRTLAGSGESAAAPGA